MDTQQQIRKENKAVRYVKDSVEELRKVTWPTRSQAINMIILVVVISLITGGLIAALDFGFTTGYEKLLEWHPPQSSETASGSTSTPITLPQGTVKGPLTIPAGSSPTNPVPLTVPSKK